MYKNRVVIIGGGTMGEIFLQAGLKLFPTENITVAQRSIERRNYLQNTYHIHVTPLTNEIVHQNDIVIVAVKPQDVMTLPASHALIVSVMAGVTTTKLTALTGSKRVVRIMPNTPAKVGLGMSVWTSTAVLSLNDKTIVQEWLKLLGKELYVENDDWIDKATAVSGSGPAYLFLFAEQLITAAKELGFTSEQAQLLVSQTLLGASSLLSDRRDRSRPVPTPQELRSAVTSKGGTTAAAINSLPQTELQNIWNKAVRAAYERAKELAP